MRDEDRYAAIDEVLERLSVLSEDHIILVEGMNDEKALRYLGINGEFVHIQSEGGPIKAAEYVYAKDKSAVVLTDWDRKGLIIMKETCDQLAALDVKYDTSVWDRLKLFCSVYIKDVESLDALMDRLNQSQF